MLVYGYFARLELRKQSKSRWKITESERTLTIRKPLIAGNWKMNTTPQEGVALAQSICRSVGSSGEVDVVLCPPFPSLIAVYGVVHHTPVMLGAQNVNQHANGAYTGEVSAEMLRDLVDYVIVGHSERRRQFNETDQIVSAKASAVIDAGMVAIVCVGEDDVERQRRRAERFVRRQIRLALSSIDAPSKVVIAYEPIWAIGTGASATIGQIEYMAASIREEVCEVFDQDVSNEMRVLYGGSTNADNIGQIVASPAVDGTLVGGASLNDFEFSSMISTMTESLTAA
jgi:triosephosphate isomerase